MLSRVTLAIVCLLGYVGLMQGNSLKQKGNRDLSSYDKAGPYVVRQNVSDPARSKLEAAVRQFVWEHWQKRRTGYVSITKYSKEGEPSTTHFFIEPENERVWRVAVSINRVVIDRRGAKRKRHEASTYNSYFLERVEVPTSGLSQLVVLPESELREPKSYRLTLKDQNGIVLTII
jgi:hypothetical protein